MGVVNFVKERVRNAPTLVRPQATSPDRNERLSPLAEDDGSNSSESSIGARGVALSLGTSSESQDDMTADSTTLSAEVMAEAQNPFHDPGYNAEKEDSDSEEEDADIEDDELSDILESISERVESGLDVSFTALGQIGVAKDREEVPFTVPKTKRVLSFNTLAALNAEVSRVRDSPKRQRNLKEVDISDSHQPLISGFSIGLSALSSEPDELPHGLPSFRVRDSPIISSSDDEALDRQLEEELGGGGDRSQDNSPVPLLTPPDSPLTIEIDGDRATICEWPSNLAVDYAMATAATDEMRSGSPDELSDLEDDDVAPTKSFDSSTLTPLLRGISVSR